MEIIQNILKEIDLTFKIGEKVNYNNDDFLERCRNKLYTNFFHFIDAVDNNSLAGFNPKFEIRTTFDY